MTAILHRKPRALLAIDPSLTATGWACFDLTTEDLRSCGVVSPPPPDLPLHYRLSVLQEGIEALSERLGIAGRDVVVCEGPAPLVKNPLSSLKVEQVRSIFEAVARRRGALVPGRLNPRSVHTELLGLSGKQLARNEVKAAARQAALRLYGDYFAKDLVSAQKRRGASTIPQDVIDALLIGALAMSRIRFANGSGSDLYAVFAERKLAVRSRSLGRRSRSKNLARWEEQDLERVAATTRRTMNRR